MRSLLVGLLLLLPACHKIGNGEGYPGLVATQKIADGTYYWLDPTYRCHPKSGGGARLSYRNAIRVKDGVRTLLGDICQPTAIEIPAATTLEYWEAPGLVGYEEGMYERRGHSPGPSLVPEAYYEAWCRDAKGDLQVSARVLPGSDRATIKISGQPGDLVAMRAGDEATLEYDGEAFHLSVTRNGQTKVPARLRLSDDEAAPATALTCRLH